MSCDFPFQHVGVDFAGPLYVRDNYSKSAELFKAYILTCIYLCYYTMYISGISYRFYNRNINISRRGKPCFFISDNFKTFISKGLKRFLLKVDISWKYILEKSPWWGDFYECIIDIIKNCLKKVI